MIALSMGATEWTGAFIFATVQRGSVCCIAVRMFQLLSAKRNDESAKNKVIRKQTHKISLP